MDAETLENRVQQLTHERDALEKALIHWQRENDTLNGELVRLRRTVSDQHGEIIIATSVAEERLRESQKFCVDATGLLASLGTPTPKEGFRHLSDVMGSLKRLDRSGSSRVTPKVRTPSDTPQIASRRFPDDLPNCICNGDGEVSLDCPFHSPNHQPPGEK